MLMAMSGASVERVWVQRVVILGSIWSMDRNGVCRGIEDNMRPVKSNVEHCADFLEIY